MRNPEAEREILQTVDEVIAAGPYSADWDSLMHAQAPAWFREEKLGIFIHWGIFSVPAYDNEWYSRNMYIRGLRAHEHHIAVYGPHARFGYKDFIPMFKAEKFDPAEWIGLFRRAGAGYLFPVAEHHDGFQMYASRLSNWNAADMGPKRDILGDLRREAEAQGMHFCTSSHRVEHWFFMGHGREFESDIREPMQKGDFYWPAMKEPDLQTLYAVPAPPAEFMDDWLARTAELILNYRPKLLYFDWCIQQAAVKPYLKKLAAFYYNCGKQWGEDVMICYKQEAMMFGSGIVEVERGSLAEAKPYPWQTDTAVARNSWCYTDSLDYKSSNEIICTLIDIVSKGGNLLLNIGPKADGTIPAGDRQILEDLGCWMDVNGEAIRGAKCWRKSQEGPTIAAEGQFQDAHALPYTSADYRFTVNHGAVYAMCMKCPENGEFTVKSFADRHNQNIPEFQGIIEKVEILGFPDAAVRWERSNEGLRVSVPGVHSDFPVTLKVTIA